MRIEPGRACDIDRWMELVCRVRESFPGLETREALEEHRAVVLDFMGRESALCAKSGEQIAGVLLFSRDPQTLCFLAVDPGYRRQHIGEKLVSCMLSSLDPAKDVAVTTYREGTPEGIAARAFYRRLGFVEGRLTEEFGSPVQEFVLKR